MEEKKINRVHWIKRETRVVNWILRAPGNFDLTKPNVETT